jgi:hypothetical protein
MQFDGVGTKVSEELAASIFRAEDFQITIVWTVTLCSLEHRYQHFGRIYGIYLQGKKFKITLHVVDTGSGAHPSSYPIGTGGLFPRGVKRPGRESDHSPPTSAEVKNTWIYTSTPPYVFMA